MREGKRKEFEPCNIACDDVNIDMNQHSFITVSYLKRWGIEQEITGL